MITIKSPKEKILYLFYENKMERYHLRDIARKIKLNVNSATRFLNQLEKSGLLVSKRDGNLKKYQIKKSDTLANIFTSFDIERLNRLIPARKRAINQFFEVLDEKPIIAFLFGSTAKETYTKESDVDILLIVNKRIDLEKAKNEVNAITGIKINCFQISYKDFLDELKLKNDRVIQSALNTGYPIFNQMLFYKEYLNGS